MRKNKYGGIFAAFDGPNRAGKSTLIEDVNFELTSQGFDVFSAAFQSAFGAAPGDYRKVVVQNGLFSSESDNAGDSIYATL